MILNSIKTLLLFGILSSLPADINAQDIKLIDGNKICEFQAPNGKEIEYVDSFKDSLLLSIDISAMTVGKKKKDIKVTYSEYFKDESSIIQLTKNGALRVSIARVIENEKKYYLYKIHLYKKDGNCWEDITVSHSWTKDSIGILNHGYATGYEGTSNYIGYKGKVIIE